MGMAAGVDEMDAPMKGPFYFLVANFGLALAILLGVFCPILQPEKGLLWDKSGWILWNFLWNCMSWYYFYKTWKTPPGYLDDKHPHIAAWRRQYEETLEAYADAAHDKKALESLPVRLGYTTYLSSSLSTMTFVKLT